MKVHRSLLLWPVLACATLHSLSAADPMPLRELLRDALYKEEVDRNPEEAAKAYQNLLEQNDAERAFAATAQFRLAEVRRKQGRKEEAIAAYRTLLTRYPEAESECKLAKENLQALGAGTPDSPAAPVVPQAPRTGGNDDTFLSEDSFYLKSLREIARKSPDRLGDKENFQKAIEKGFSKSLDYLLTNATPSEQVPVLSIAVEAGSLEVVRQILKKPQLISDKERSRVLALAASRNQYFIAEELLKQGFDVNGNPTYIATYMPDRWEGAKPPIGQIYGPALTTAIAYGNAKLIDLFLAAKPNVNIQSANGSTTALHAAVCTHNLPVVEALLKLGADPNLLMKSSIGGEAKLTVLGSALTMGSIDLIPAIVKAGGNLGAYDNLSLNERDVPDRESLPPAFSALLESGFEVNSIENILGVVSSASPTQMRILLDHGLNPNLKGGNTNLLLLSLQKGDSGTVRRLLDAGVKPEDDDQRGFSTLQMAINAEASVDLLEELIAKGATIGSLWEKNAVEIPGQTRPSNTSPMAVEARTLLFRKFLLPKLEPAPLVRIVYQRDDRTVVDTLSKRTPSTKPDCLEALLISPDLRLFWLHADGKRGPEKVTIWREGKTGERTSIETDLRTDSPFPVLEWGDVVEFSYSKEDANVFSASNNQSRAEDIGIPAELQWKFRQRISVPVTMEMDGESTPLTLRGGLVTLDPTRPEAPLMGAAQLARIYSKRKPGIYLPETVSVIRDGWPEVRVATSSDPATDFPLLAGDRIKWSVPNTPPSPDGIVRIPAGDSGRILIHSPGLPVGLIFQAYQPGSEAPAPNQPTLIQAISALYAPANAELKKAPEGPPQALAQWLPTGLEGKVISVLPHPDLGHIRILRNDAQGKEQVVEVDLQKSADLAAAGTMSAEEARAADVQLKPGDTVQVPVLPGQADKPWSGFSDGQRALFEKALSGTIQVTTVQSKIEMRPIIYRVPRMVETPGGIVPLPDPAGTSSVVLSDNFAPGNYVSRSPEGKEWQIESPEIFLSERYQFQEDQLWNAQPVPLPQQPSGMRPPQATGSRGPRVPAPNNRR